MYIVFNTPVPASDRRLVRPGLPHWMAVLFAGALACVGLSPVCAQTGATGSITGRVFKPATGEYVRYAEVRVDGTTLTTESDQEGVYRLTEVPVGTATVLVSYTGYETSRASVKVVAGATATLDFNLLTAQQAKYETKEGVMQLDAFVVAAEAEGRSKTIQNQKRSTTIGDFVSSDEFGDVVEGNVGEFLKHLPGVELEYVQFDARGPRLRGLDPQYVGVTMDGVKLASADAFNATVGTDNQGTEGSRAFGFESISLSSIDSVEVFKNLSADLDADAPAGTINLRSKRAFDRRGRRISYTASLSADSEEFHLRRTTGPGDHKSYKTRPSGSLEFSDTFLGNRLGVVLNYSRSSIYNEFQQFSMTTVNRTPTTADTRAAVPNTLTFTDGPKVTDRETLTFRFDFKVTPELSVGVNTTFATYHGSWDNRQFRFVTSTNNSTAGTGRQTVLGADPMVSFTTSSTTGASLTLTGDGADKFTDTTSILPSFDWKPTSNLTIEGRGGWSKSDNQYRAISEGKARSAAVNALSGIQYTAVRSSPASADWKITQTGGADWGDASNYLNPRVTDEGRSDYNEVYTGGIDTTWKHPVLGLPAFLKFGAKSREEYRKFTDRRNWLSYSYIGPGGGSTGSFGFLPPADPVDLSGIDSYFPSLSGRAPGFAGRSFVASLYRDHPEYFVPNTAAQTTDNYYSAFIANNRNIIEQVDAAYLLGNIKLGRLEVQSGARYEKTTDRLTQPSRRSTAELAAAGYGYSTSTGRATTIPGLQYQFQSLPTNESAKDYDNVFGSMALKYAITRNLIAQFGAHEAIRRPQLTVLSGVASYSESSLTITAPNPGLKPEESRNYSGKLAYYLPSAGTLSVGIFQIDVKNLFVDNTRAAGTWWDDFPEIDHEQYAAYALTSTTNSSANRRFRGMELEYNQTLSFLPGFWRNTNVYANYTRNYADARRGGLVPHQISTGANFRYKRLTLGGSVKWTDDTPWTNVAGAIKFRGARTTTDLNASFFVNHWVTISLSGRDVGNVGQELFEQRDGQPKELVQKDIYGALWTLSVKGTF